MGNSTEFLRRLLKDMGLGALIFVLLPLLALAINQPKKTWHVSEAVAGEAIATRAVELTAPGGVKTENAIVGAIQMRPSSDPLLMRRVMAAGVLCLTFSLLVALNLGFWRHLRSVETDMRRDRRKPDDRI